MMDRLADELGMDRLELRRKNFIPKGGVPVRDGARDRLRLGRLRGHARQAARALRPRRVPRSRSGCGGEGVYRGVGFSTYVEVRGLAPSRAGPAGRGPPGRRSGSPPTRVTPTGSAIVYTPASPHGQGLDDELRPDRGDTGIDPQNGMHCTADTDQGPGAGTRGWLALARGGRRGDRARGSAGAGQGQKICAALLEAAPEDIELTDGKYQVRGSPDKSMTMAEIPAAHIPPNELPADVEPGRGERLLRPGELRVPLRRARVRSRSRRPGRCRWCATSRWTTAARRSTRC